MNFFFLVTNGRSGSDFFHSLLDNHKDIATFPGIIDIAKLENIFSSSANDRLFIKYFCKKYDFFFNSNKNKLENHHKLGKYKNQFFIFDKVKFENFFLKKNLNNKNFKITVENLHIAYHVSCRKKSIKNLKTIFIHIHHAKKLINFNSINYKLFYCYRHPVSILNSGFNAFLNSKKNLFSHQTLYFYLHRLITEPFDLKINKKVYLVKLEKLHKENKNVLKKISNILGVSFNSSMLKSTYHGKLWWGDSLSQKKMSNFNKNILPTYNKNNFFSHEIFFLQKILENEMKYLNYDLFKVDKCSFIKIFLLFKIEFVFLTHHLKKLNIKQIFFFSIYYLKRISLFIRKILFKKNKKYFNKIYIV